MLLTESASLTCRETLTVLGRAGVTADVISSGRWTIGQFSRWRGRSLRLPDPAQDPTAYLSALDKASRDVDVVLPTHEQAWLIAAGRRLLAPGFPAAIADITAFDRVQSKVEFARLLDELGLPQPRWWLPDELPRTPVGPVWIKAAFGTAGRGVRRATSGSEVGRFVAELAEAGMPVMIQEEARGEYGQAQALFAHGLLVAVHTSVLVGQGMGGSAAARLSVDHPVARAAIGAIGAALNWHGGLTIDYIHVDGRPLIIECNPRTVEPGNAAAAGVNLPELSIGLTLGRLPGHFPVIGQPGVRTHSTLALALGAAQGAGTRRAVLGSLPVGGGPVSTSEVLTPIREDRRSLVPLVVPVLRTLLAPGSAERIATQATDRYAVTAAMVATVRQ